MNKPRLQIIIGAPGAGKSTFARTNWPHLLNIEVDHFCMHGGTYDTTRGFSGARTGALETARLMISKKLDFTVNDVFTACEEPVNSLVGEAVAAGYDVWIHALRENYGNVHNVHSVIVENIRKMIPDDDFMIKKWGKDVHIGVMPKGYRQI